VPEFRKDPVLANWVLFPSTSSAEPAACPFCAAVDAGEIGEARVGILKTPAPILDRRLVVDRERHAGELYMSMTGAGEHETILESKVHGARMSDFPPDHVAEILAQYRARLLFLRQDNRFRHMVIVKKEGLGAGAAYDHPCSEVFALPFIPESVKAKMHGIQGHHRRTGACAYCDIVRHERHDKTRKVAESLHHLAIAPYASETPYEVMILPKGHHADFAESSDPDLLDCATLLLDVLSRLDHVRSDPAFTLVVETAPEEVGAGGGAFHWHIEIHPAGDRRSTLLSIAPVNFVTPEDAARALREADG
jgi:UDPglucose--hexose-1-phosphate uridylyltransferase